ncbi:MAG: heavy metal translocating P-type ATPase, partial [Pseudomonadota bacterium]|nr:heavy metal translocating P-type ATPase [Pseudomonadota bacterium]
MNAPLALDTQGSMSMRDSRFTVPGMRCAGCISKIERGLEKLEGVDAARVNFSAKRVAVRHHEWLGEDDLIEAIAAIGFEAQPVADNPMARDDHESAALMRALAVAGFGMMNIMLLSVSVWSGAEGVTRDLFHWLSAMIALPVVAYAGRPFFASAAMALRHRRTNMDVPISIGVLLATGLSLYETIAGTGHAYFDSAVMLLFFLLAGRALDATMRNRTRAGIGALLSRMGRSAMVLDESGAHRTVAAEGLERGMLMIVAAGEALAADGVIEEGETTLDNAMLTGESAPQTARVGDTVYAGAINLGNAVRVRVTEAASDTALAGIARLMDEAGQSRSHYVRIADRASRLYAPAVHSLALLAFAGWMIAGAGWYQSLVIAIAVLIITCPCAMGLAVPAAQVVASGALARNGLLVKDGSALERLAEIDIALFDKTGTLTVGEPVPEMDHLTDRQAAIALTLARTSRHPLSKSITRALEGRDVQPVDLSGVQEMGGNGVSAVFGGIAVALTRPDTGAFRIATGLRIGDEVTNIAFDDPVRHDAQMTLDELAAAGIESAVVSGDRAGPVSAVAADLGLESKAELHPDAKLAHIEKLKSAGQRPLMVGDGINDGPALAAAHASIAPGSASDVSQQA